MTELQAVTSAQESGEKVGNPTATTMFSPAVPAIIDAVQDPDGDKYFRFGTHERSIWFSLRDFMRDEKATFVRLSSITTLLTSAARHSFKAQVEGYTAFRDGVIASAPGWCGHHFVLGDGEVVSPEGSDEEVIVAFERQAKFERRGSVEEWKVGIGPIVTDEPILLSILSSAFIGPMMKFLPPDFITPMIELVGDRETGKTTTALLAASVWAGRLDDESGGAETWKTTLNALDATRAHHRHMLLVLDEANLVSVEGKKAAIELSNAVMHLVTPQQKVRMTDAGKSLQVKLAILSTSNVPLADLFTGSASVKAAVESRSMTVRVPKKGVLTYIPSGFNSTQDAIHELHAITARCFGVAGHIFVQRLVRSAANGDAVLRDRVERHLGKCDARLRRLGSLISERHMKIFCLLLLAARVATRSDCLDKDWGTENAVIELYRRQLKRPENAKRPEAHVQIKKYVSNNKLIEQGDPTHDPQKCDVNEVGGYIAHRDSIRRIFIGVQRFMRAFPDHRELLAELKAQGSLRSEGGKSPKLSIKAPSAFAAFGRVYCILLPATAGDSMLEKGV